MDKRLEGKIALVTGGGGGIGAATALLFAEEGARVALVDNDATAVTDVAQHVENRGGGKAALPIIADLSKEAEIKRAVETAHQHFGKLHILVNVAGVRVYGPLSQADTESWNLILEVNLLATANCCKHVLPFLRSARGGSIVNVSSVFGIAGRAGMGQYDATKAAVLSLTRTLAIEETAYGIRVNAVCPGPTITPFHIERAKARGQAEEELRRTGADHTLLKRWAEPREVAYPILFLASDESSYMTGTALMVDGGVSII